MALKAAVRKLLRLLSARASNAPGIAVVISEHGQSVVGTWKGSNHIVPVIDSDEVPIETGLTYAIVEVLRQLGVRPATSLFSATRRASAVIVFTEDRAKLKRIEGLPQLKDHRLIRTIVMEGVERFFLLPAEHVHVGVSVSDDGVIHAAIYDAAAVEKAVHALRSAKLRVRSVGCGSLELTASVGSARYRLSDLLAPMSPDLLKKRPSTRWRAAKPMAMGSALTAFTAGLFAPGAILRLEAARIESRLSAMESAAAEAQQLSSQQGRVTSRAQMVARIESLDASPTMFLARVAGLLPQTTSITQVELTAKQGRLTLAGDSLASAVTRLEDGQAVRKLSLAGSIRLANEAGGPPSFGTISVSFQREGRN